MSVSNCEQCRYLDRHPYHQSDIVCGLNPAYASMWLRLKSIDEYSLNCLPIDHCREFELDPSFEEKSISLSLLVTQWQQLIRETSIPTISQVFSQTNLEIALTLPLSQWQAIADHACDPHVIEQLANHQIHPTENEWIEVDSSCIDAIAHDSTTNTLKIRFLSDDVYQYDDVDSATFSDFRNAASKGQFFNYHIKDVFHFQLV